MILNEFSYSELEDTPNAWKLSGLHLEDVNLIVGKNATGKTNTINRISWLGGAFAGRMPVNSDSANYNVRFLNDDDIYYYELKIRNQIIMFESLRIGGETKFERDAHGRGTIYSNELNGYMNFQLSTNQLVVSAKRDELHHSFLVELVNWAEGQGVYAFSHSIMEQYQSDELARLYKKGCEEFNHEFKMRIMDYMREIGYELTDISAEFPGNPQPVLHIREKDSDAIIYQRQISQGMFRALSLIIHITYYNIFRNLSTTILVDDIGEGLDFDRATKIIELITKLAKDGKCQLIMSTNDRFVMNSIDLKYWQVIQRKGGECQVFNYKNSERVFKEFEYTGLSNFDFLRTDFINEGLE